MSIVCGSEADAYVQKVRGEAEALETDNEEKRKNLFADAEEQCRQIRAEAEAYSQQVRSEADDYRKEAQKVVKELVSSHEWLMKGLQ